MFSMNVFDIGSGVGLSITTKAVVSLGWLDLYLEVWSVEEEH